MPVGIKSMALPPKSKDIKDVKSWKVLLVNVRGPACCKATCELLRVSCRMSGLGVNSPAGRVVIKVLSRFTCCKLVRPTNADVAMASRGVLLNHSDTRFGSAMNALPEMA